MANTDITSRTQYERTDLLRRRREHPPRLREGRGDLQRHRAAGRRSARRAAVATIENWAQWLVLGVIVLTTVGFMIAVSPNAAEPQSTATLRPRSVCRRGVRLMAKPRSRPIKPRRS